MLGELRAYSGTLFSSPQCCAPLSLSSHWAGGSWSGPRRAGPPITLTKATSSKGVRAEMCKPLLQMDSDCGFPIMACA